MTYLDENGLNRLWGRVKNDLVAPEAALRKSQVQALVSTIEDLTRKLIVTSANARGVFAIEDVVSGTSYSRTVGSGAMHLASIDKVGGKTIVWNQLVNNGNFADASDTWTSNTPSSTSRTISDGVITITVLNATAGSSSATFPRTGIKNSFVSGHKYIYSFDAKANTELLQDRAVLILGRSRFNPSSIGNWEHVDGIAIAPDDISVDSKCVSILTWNAQNASISLKNFFIIDLTAMFGAGNEPSTVAEFRAMFQNDYYDYSAPTLLNADVVNVKSVGKNLWNPNQTMIARQAYNVPVGTNILTMTDFSSRVSVSYLNNEISIRINSSWAGNCFLFPVSSGITYTISSSNSISGGQFRTTWYTLDSSGVVLRNIDPSFSLPNKTITVSNGESYICLYVGNADAFAAVTLTNPQVEVGSIATPYSPYGVKGQLQIPQAVRNLCPNYGASAGTAYNYIDFNRKVYVQNVASVDLGTLTWTYSSGTQFLFSSVISGIKKPSSGWGTTNIICANYVSKSRFGIETTDKSISIHTTGEIWVNDSSYTDAAAFKTAMSGVMLYYELETPVEVDLSSVLSDDNLIEVGAGVTLTFENSHGDGYRIPVPNQETFEIDCTQ